MLPAPTNSNLYLQKAEAGTTPTLKNTVSPAPTSHFSSSDIFQLIEYMYFLLEYFYKFNKL